VTGASGFIGWHVCEHLCAAGWRVAAIVRPGGGKPVPAGAEPVPADLDATGLVEACANAEVIVHAAGVTKARSLAEYRRVNVEGTRAVAETARALGARMIHVSSLTAAGPAPADRPRTESDTREPITDYGRSKLEAEELIERMAGLRWTIVRPAAVYGPRDRQFLPLFQAARRGLFLRPANAATFAMTFVHVDDVARAMTMACDRSSVDGDILFLGFRPSRSFDDLLRTLALTFDRSYHPLPVPLAMVRLGAWLGVGGLGRERVCELMSPGFVCNVDRASRCLGFQATIDLESGCRATAAWYAAARWLS
jgi:nucleoside-diphosphate-sugar epimerase